MASVTYKAPLFYLFIRIFIVFDENMQERPPPCPLMRVFCPSQKALEDPGLSGVQIMPLHLNFSTFISGIEVGDAPLLSARPDRFVPPGSFKPARKLDRLVRPGKEKKDLED